MTWSTWVNRSTPWQSASVTTPTGFAAVDHDRGAVRALADEGQRGVHRVVRADDDRGLDDGVPRLDRDDDLGDDVRRHVLGQDGDAAAAGDRLGHPAAGDGRHVGDDDGDGGAGAVDGREVDVEAGGDLGTRRDEEDVAVGEVGGGRVAGQEAHGFPPFRSMVVARRPVFTVPPHAADLRQRVGVVRVGLQCGQAFGVRTVRHRRRTRRRRHHHGSAGPHQHPGRRAPAHLAPGRRPRRRDPHVPRRPGLPHRWSPRTQPRRRRADHRDAPGVRVAAGHHGLRHGPPGVRAQAAHRPPRLLAAAQQGRAVRVPEPRGVRARRRRELARVDRAELGRRHRQGQRAAGPRRPARRRGDRRRRPDRRDGLGGAEQHRRRAGPPAGDRRQRQRPLLRADHRRPRAPPRHPAHDAAATRTSCPGASARCAGPARPAARPTTRCTA